MENKEQDIHKTLLLETRHFYTQEFGIPLQQMSNLVLNQLVQREVGISHLFNESSCEMRQRLLW